MVVEEDHSRSVLHQGFLDDPAMVDDGGCDGTYRDHHLGQWPMGVVEKEYPAFLMVQVVKFFTEEPCGCLRACD